MLLVLLFLVHFNVVFTQTTVVEICQDKQPQQYTMASSLPEYSTNRMKDIVFDDHYYAFALSSSGYIAFQRHAGLNYIGMKMKF